MFNLAINGNTKQKLRLGCLNSLKDYALRNDVKHTLICTSDGVSTSKFAERFFYDLCEAWYKPVKDKLFKDSSEFDEFFSSITFGNVEGSKAGVLAVLPAGSFTRRTLASVAHNIITPLRFPAEREQSFLLAATLHKDGVPPIDAFWFSSLFQNGVTNGYMTPADQTPFNSIHPFFSSYEAALRTHRDIFNFPAVKPCGQSVWYWPLINEWVATNYPQVEEDPVDLRDIIIDNFKHAGSRYSDLLRVLPDVLGILNKRRSELELAFSETTQAKVA